MSQSKFSNVILLTSVSYTFESVTVSCSYPVTSILMNQHKIKGEFIRQIAELGAAITIYERGFFENVNRYFHQPVHVWDAMKAELQLYKIDLKLSTIHDVNFHRLHNQTLVRTMITCKPMNVEMPPAATSRGFIRV